MAPNRQSLTQSCAQAGDRRQETADATCSAESGPHQPSDRAYIPAGDSRGYQRVKGWRARVRLWRTGRW